MTYNYYFSYKREFGLASTLVIETRGVQKTHQLVKPDPTQANPPGWVGF